MYILCGYMEPLGFSGCKGSYLGHFQVGSYRYRSVMEGLYTLQWPYI